MGIKGLMKLLGDVCPEVVEEHELKSYFGRRVAIDASMSLYSFLVAVRPEMSATQFTTAAGETTSHLLGLWTRTIRWMRLGLRPVYVFDGTPPEMKREELRRRSAVKSKAREEESVAREEGDAEAEAKLARRSVRVTREMNEEAQRLLRAMGVPLVIAPSEAEAQCVQLCRMGIVYGVGTEDMDTLPLGTPVLLRDLAAPEAQKKPVREIRLARVLEGLHLDMAQFIDLCILCGCDYAPQIRGVGPKRAYELVRKYGSIENILTSPEMTKFTVPEPYPFESARKLFLHPDVTTEAPALDWTEPNEEDLIKLLVEEKQFDETRVRSGIDKIRACRKQPVQGRLDDFFSTASGAKPSAPRIAKKPSGPSASHPKLSGKARGTGPKNASASAATPQGSSGPKKTPAVSAAMKLMASARLGESSKSQLSDEPCPAISDTSLKCDKVASLSSVDVGMNEIPRVDEKEKDKEQKALVEVSPPSLPSPNSSQEHRKPDPFARFAQTLSKGSVVQKDKVSEARKSRATLPNASKKSSKSAINQSLTQDANLPSSLQNERKMNVEDQIDSCHLNGNLDGGNGLDGKRENDSRKEPDGGDDQPELNPAVRKKPRIIQTSDDE